MLFMSILLMGCQPDKQELLDTSNEPFTGDPLEGKTDGLGEYSQSTETWTDETTENSLTVYKLQRPSTSDVPSEDRGLSRLLFYFNSSNTPVLEIDKSGGFQFFYDYSADHYHVTFSVQHANFSKSETVFALRDLVHETTQTQEGVDSISDLEMTACRFNRKLLDYAASNLEQRIGDGECWSLIDFALNQADAHAPIYYRFGNHIGSGDSTDFSVLNEAMPGDILQFDSGLFLDANGYENVAGFPNHTSLIRTISGSQITVFEQNSPIGAPVRIGAYDFNTMQSGSFRIYRAFPHPNSPEAPHCDPPAGQIFAYDALMGTDSNGTDLLRLTLMEKPDFVGFDEYCQFRCDGLTECNGYLQTSNDCTLKGEGELFQSGGGRYMVKVKE